MQLVFLGNEPFHNVMSFDDCLPRCFFTNLMIQAEEVTGLFETKSGYVQGQGAVRQFTAVCYDTALLEHSYLPRSDVLAQVLKMKAL